jgi:hypothetical protein
MRRRVETSWSNQRIAEACFFRQPGLDGLTAGRALALLKNPMGDIHLDFGELDLLMRVKGLEPAPLKVAVATTAMLRLQGPLPGRCEHLLDLDTAPRKLE